MFQSKVLNKSKGSALSEYGLAVALIAMVTIGGLSILGQQMGTQLGVVNSDVSALSVITGGVAGNTQTNTAITVGFVAAGAAGQNESGHSIVLDSVTAAGSDYVTQTTGSNGSTETMSIAQEIEQMANQFVTEFGPDDPLSKKFVTLANSVHDLADQQQRMDTQTNDNNANFDHLQAELAEVKNQFWTAAEDFDNALYAGNQYEHASEIWQKIERADYIADQYKTMTAGSSPLVVSGGSPASQESRAIGNEVCDSGGSDEACQR